MDASTTPSPAAADSARSRRAPTEVQALELSELGGAAAPTPGPGLLHSDHPLRQVKATLQVCVGAATLTVGDLMAAQENQVMVLDRSVDQPVDLLLEGQVVARGQLVAVDDRFAVRITELPLPLQFSAPAAA